MPRARNAIASTATRTPRIVTTRTPLFDEAGWREDGADLGEMRSGIFSMRNLDDPNHVEMAGEIRPLAQRVWRCFWRQDLRPSAETLIGLLRRGITVHIELSRCVIDGRVTSQSVISSSSRASFLVFASDISIQTFSPKALR